MYTIVYLDNYVRDIPWNAVTGNLCAYIKIFLINKATATVF